jgi:hypothetical protein
LFYSPLARANSICVKFKFRAALQKQREESADVAQLVEQLICNHQVAGSTPVIGFKIYRLFSHY